METTMRHSRSKTSNAHILDWTDSHKRKSNLDFFADALTALGEMKSGHGGLMAIGLIGSCDLPGVALRQAQSVLRWDMRPSLWSHAFLIADKITDLAQGGEAKTLGVSLHPRTSEFPRPENNGVSEGRLKLYKNSKLDANAALFVVKMTKDEVQTVAARAADPNRDRQRYNLWESLGVWQGFLWSFGQRPNPLREGFPIPAASFVEYCFEGLSLDLTPGASERNSAPEHLYNAAKYWHEAFETQNRFISGCYVLRDRGCSLMDTAEGAAPAKKTR